MGRKGWWVKVSDILESENGQAQFAALKKIKKRHFKKLGITYIFVVE